jgi:uncharacterized protein YbjT (DUF2867 family)
VILVAGATGHVGGEVCRLLMEQGQSVRALVRTTSDPVRVGTLRELGAEIVVGDLREAETLAAACAGANAVVSTATAASPGQPGDGVVVVDGTGQCALVDAAVAAGVEQYIFVSFSGNLSLPTPFHDSKRQVEQRLQQSPMTWTILRPSAFMEVWLSPAVGFDVPAGQLTVYGSGGAPISYVSLFDVARFCIEALRNPAAANRVIEIGGPDAVTPLQVARIAEDLTGRPMQIHQVPVEALQAQYESGVDALEKSFAGLMLALSRGDAIDMRATLQTFPLGLRTVRDFISSAYAPALQAGPSVTE